MADYATVQDVAALWRPLTADETARVGALIPVVSDIIRVEAANRGKDFDRMLADNTALKSAAKAVTVDVIVRILRQNTSGEPVSQESQSALGYSWSGTYAIPGGGMANALMRNDLKRLGLLKQRIGVIDYAFDGRDD